ncbi:hypothetical protein GNI_070480 [Gregarina niphandrodes]|uniref:Uncharacterized protein n=1 Tax=Gregarina niphandrodes TaxID=110365 RepID=A0A023B7B8_GRENI|nr:hypothetical protein GNI_070480 [Gregarina niphandrodes]EZG67209.1 hypothetical protein GNI_070480 [Gregarina niphandrodes]|eukprot:XP_011130298.1 hypothetical protein GNI_070480 [Gregarina niphandrodes]
MTPIEGDLRRRLERWDRRFRHLFSKKVSLPAPLEEEKLMQEGSDVDVKELSAKVHEITRTLKHRNAAIRRKISEEIKYVQHRENVQDRRMWNFVKSVFTKTNEAEESIPQETDPEFVPDVMKLQEREFRGPVHFLAFMSGPWITVTVTPREQSQEQQSSA